MSRIYRGVMDLKATSYELHGRTAVITLDRPDRGNAWTGRMDTEYRWLLDRADKDPDVRVIVIAGGKKVAEVLGRRDTAAAEARE